jgi:hypothetical protein
MFNFRYQNSGQNHGSDRRVTLEEYRHVCALAGLLRNDSSKWNWYLAHDEMKSWLICKMLAISSFRIFYFPAGYKKPIIPPAVQCDITLTWACVWITERWLAWASWGCCGGYLGVGGRKWLNEEENCKVWRSIIYILCSVFIKSWRMRWARDVACIEAWPMNANFPPVSVKERVELSVLGAAAFCFGW